MCNWLSYIVLLISFLYRPATAEPAGRPRHRESVVVALAVSIIDSAGTTVRDTVSKKQNDDKKKIKEVNKARHVPKPERVDAGRPRRFSRPPGLERPPEIPRHNGN